MSDTSKTTKASKAQAATAHKVDAAEAKTGEVKSIHQFTDADELAHFIQHSPEFGTLPLDEQDALRAELIALKRGQVKS